MSEYRNPELYPYELPSGETLHVAARHYGDDYSAYVLPRDEGDWVVTWTDGINHWVEEYEQPWHAYARLAALVAAVEQRVFLVHDGQRQPGELPLFVSEVERFVSRTVHASSCTPGCDGTDPANHGGTVSSAHPVWQEYWAMWCEVNETDEHPADEATPERQDDLLGWLLNTR